MDAIKRVCALRMVHGALNMVDEGKKVAKYIVDSS